MAPESFERFLLSQVEVCYSAALALTRDPYDARDLTRAAVTNVWYLHDSSRGDSSIVMELLAVLRRRFIAAHCGTPCKVVLAGESKRACTSQETVLNRSQCSYRDQIPPLSSRPADSLPRKALYRALLRH